MQSKITHTKVKWIKALTITILCVLIFYTCKSMFSSVLTIRPETSIISWEKKKEPINVDLAISFTERLKKSIAINPSNAKNHFLLARLYELLAFQENSSIKNTYLVNAKKSYQQAILNQPTWDIAWARLALLNNKTNNKKQAINALEKALYLGPYENKNQSIIIPLLIKYWSVSEFVQKNKSQIIKVFSHALKFKKNHTLLLNTVLKSKNINLLHFIAPLIKHEHQLKKFNKHLSDNNLPITHLKSHVPNE